MLTMKTKVLLGSAAGLTFFASGYYTASLRQAAVHTIVDSTKTKETEIAKDTHKDTTTTTEKKPDGTVKTITHIVEDTDTKKIAQTDTITHLDQTVTPPKSSTLNISALVGIDYNTVQPTYGISVTKQVLGPVTIGIMGLTNHTVAASIGLSF